MLQVEFKVSCVVVCGCRRRDTAGHTRTQGKVGGESKLVKVVGEKCEVERRQFRR